MAVPGKMGMLEAKFRAWGHPLVSARDPQKIIITKGSKVFDDSVIAIRSELAAADLSDDFKAALKERKKVSLRIHTAGTQEKIEAFGAFDMKLTDPEKITLTRTDFSDSSTVGVRANKSAADLLRNLVSLLQTEDQEITLTLRVMES